MTLRKESQQCLYICNTYGCYQNTGPGQAHCAAHSGPNDKVTQPQQSNINIYNPGGGRPTVQVQFDDQGQVWLTAKEIGVLYGRNVKTVMKHIQAILKEKEFTSEVVALFATTSGHHRSRSGTQSKNTAHYSLDMILTVGMRVHSNEARYFRMWAREHLRNVLRHGYSLSTTITPDELQELSSNVHKLRLKIGENWMLLDSYFQRGIGSQLDDPQREYAHIRAILCYAVTGRVPAVILMERCDETKPNCGRNERYTDAKDVLTAIAYFTEKELKLYSELQSVIDLTYPTGDDKSLKAIHASIKRELTKRDRPVLESTAYTIVEDIKYDILMRFSVWESGAP